MRCPPANRRRLLNWGLVAWLALLGPAVLAQTTQPCDSLLEAAEERYIQREFADAEALVRTCLSQPDLDDAEAQRAHRQLALIHLRQDDLAEAKQAVLRLFGVSFEYAPDPVRDPPAYVALVASIKEQLRVEQMRAPTDSAQVGPPVAQAPPSAPETDVRIVQSEADPSEGPAPSVERAPEREERGFVRWLLIGGGALAAGVAAVMLTSGDSPSSPSGGDPFPPPPAFPR